MAGLAARNPACMRISRSWPRKDQWLPSDLQAADTKTPKHATPCKASGNLLASTRKVYSGRLLFAVMLLSSLVSFSAATQVADASGLKGGGAHRRKLQACTNTLTPIGATDYLLGSVTDASSNHHDLYIIEYPFYQSTYIQVHKLSASQDYQCVETTVTGIYGATPDTHQFLMDTTTNDLYVIEREVLFPKVTRYTYASRWTQQVSYSLSCPRSSDCSAYKYDFQLDSGNNLFAFEYTDWSFIFHTFSAASNYTSDTLNSSISLITSRPRQFKFLVSKVNSNVFRYSYYAFTTSISEYTAASRYQQLPTDFERRNGILLNADLQYNRFLMGDSNDLYVVNFDPSRSTGRVELYVLSSSSSYNNYTLQSKIGIALASRAGQGSTAPSHSNRRMVAAIAGGAAAGGACLIIIVAAAVVWLRNKKTSSKQHSDEDNAAVLKCQDSSSTSVLATVLVANDNPTAMHGAK